MVDQQSKFSLNSLSTKYVGEAQHDLAVKEKVLNGEIQLVYIFPEFNYEQDLLEYASFTTVLEKSFCFSNRSSLCKNMGRQFPKNIC